MTTRSRDTRLAPCERRSPGRRAGLLGGVLGAADDPHPWSTASQNQGPGPVGGPPNSTGAEAPRPSARRGRSRAADRVRPVPAVLLVTSNGTGLGHLARMTALARALQEQGADPVLASMSAALPLVLDATGLRGEYISGPARSWVDPRRWQAYAAERIVALAREVRAEIVVYDGVAPYAAIVGARAGLPDVAFVWFRRGLWKRGTNRRALWTARAFDLVVEPGDICAAADVGATVRAPALHVPPVSLARYWPAVDRGAARERLGLHAERPAALVMLGTSAGGDLAGPGNAAVAAVLADPAWQVAVTELPLRESPSWLVDRDRVVALRGVFPLAPLLGAFDLAVAGAGY